MVKSRPYTRTSIPTSIFRVKTKQANYTFFHRRWKISTENKSKRYWIALFNVLPLHFLDSQSPNSQKLLHVSLVETTLLFDHIKLFFYLFNVENVVQPSWFSSAEVEGVQGQRDLPIKRDMIFFFLSTLFHK